jgi:hypothetical protein
MGQASRPYSKQGKHLDLMRLKIISSEAEPPILPYIALNARKKRLLSMKQRAFERSGTHNKYSEVT